MVQTTAPMKQHNTNKSNKTMSPMKTEFKVYSFFGAMLGSGWMFLFFFEEIVGSDWKVLFSFEDIVGSDWKLLYSFVAMLLVVDHGVLVIWVEEAKVLLSKTDWELDLVESLVEAVGVLARVVKRQSLNSSLK